MIYVARNPKDAIVSFFYFHKLVKLCYYAGEMDDFVDYFINNKRKHLQLQFEHKSYFKWLNACSAVDPLFSHRPRGLGQT